jgi:hypothetical protein
MLSFYVYIEFKIFLLCHLYVISELFIIFQYPFAGKISSAKIKANNAAKTGSNENIRRVRWSCILLSHGLTNKSNCTA